jgi:hypothetical protein
VSSSGLGYDALFGLDVDDVASCHEAAIAFVDKLRQALNRVRRPRLNDLADAPNTHRLSEVTVNPTNICRSSSPNWRSA